MPKDIFESPEDKELGTIAIAYHYGTGTPLDEIPARIREKCSTVFLRTYIKKAVASGFLDLNPKFNPERVPADAYRRFERKYLERNQLKDKLSTWSDHPPEFNVHDSSSLPEFSTKATPVLTSLLKDSRKVGVLGGTTLDSLVQVLRSRIGETKGIKVRFTPLSGACTSVLHNNRHAQEASTISSRLEKALNHDVDPHAPVLAGVPAYIGTSQNVRAVKDYIESITGYRRIFSYDEPSPIYPMIDHIDTIVTAIGAFWEPSKGKLEAGEYLKERAAQEEITLKELATLVYGDIGGHLLIREGLSKNDQKRVAQYNENWMGLKARHLEAVADRARRSEKNRPGCVVIAYQSSKALAIKEAVKRGYVNHLIVSNELEEALLALP